jgi:flagellar biogenesis protein FliO
MVFYCQPVLMLLPWQYVLPIQVASTYSLLVYMRQFPCFLQVGCRAGRFTRWPGSQWLGGFVSGGFVSAVAARWPALSGLLAAGRCWGETDRAVLLPCVLCALQHVQPDPSTYVWQARAKLACSKLQSYAAIVSTAVSSGSLSDHSTTVCEAEGFAGVQALQIFGTILCLFVLPLVVTYEFERWARSRPRGALPQSPPARSNGSTSSSAGSQHSLGSSSASGSGNPGAAGSSNGSVSSRVPPVLQPLPQVTRHADFLLDLAETEAEAAWGTCGHVCLLLLVLALVLPVCWLLSELLAEWFAATSSCPSVIAAATSR